jgi:hypothetical protein
MKKLIILTIVLALLSIITSYFLFPYFWYIFCDTSLFHEKNINYGLMSINIFLLLLFSAILLHIIINIFKYNKSRHIIAALFFIINIFAVYFSVKSIGAIVEWRCKKVVCLLNQYPVDEERILSANIFPFYVSDTRLYQGSSVFIRSRFLLWWEMEYSVKNGWHFVD